jgi:hypothetical protein
MKRLVALTLAGLALALPATALASHSETLTRLGSGYSSKSATGSCTVTRSTLLGTATLRCSGSTGSAIARYTFKLPADYSGSISPHVDTLIGSPRVGVSKPVAGVVRVTVRTSGPSRVVVAMVSASYYCS